jgi:hypothetical protein
VVLKREVRPLALCTSVATQHLGNMKADQIGGHLWANSRQRNSRCLKYNGRSFRKQGSVSKNVFASIGN